MTLILFVLGLRPGGVRAQQLTYSVPMGDNIRTTRFDVVGRCGGRLFIYKNTYDDYKMAVYDRDMKILDEVPLDFLKEDLEQEDFVCLKDRVIAIYQYTRRRDLYAAWVMLGPDARPLGKPQLIDKTSHPSRVVGSKAYTVLHSASKSRIMVLEVLRNPDSLTCLIRTFLYDSSMQLQRAGTIRLPSRDDSYKLDGFSLADDGSLYFTYGRLDDVYSNHYRSVNLCCQRPSRQPLVMRPLPSGEAPLRYPVLVKVDEPGGFIWLAALYTDDDGRDVAGLRLGRYRPGSLTAVRDTRLPLTDSLRRQLRSRGAGLRQAFNDYRLCGLVPGRGAQSLLVAEQRYQGQDDVTHYDNIALFDVSATGVLTGAGTIDKAQGGELDPPYASFLMVNTGHALHFLINKAHRVFRFLNNTVNLLTDYRYGADHRLTQLPLPRGLSPKIRWAPRYGMQVSLTEVVIPCVEGGGLLFGKIDYGSGTQGMAPVAGNVRAP